MIIYEIENLSNFQFSQLQVFENFLLFELRQFQKFYDSRNRKIWVLFGIFQIRNCGNF